LKALDFREMSAGRGIVFWVRVYNADLPCLTAQNLHPLAIKYQDDAEKIGLGGKWL
jgi:hypothetical protein